MRRLATAICVFGALGWAASAAQERRFEQPLELYRHGDLAAIEQAARLSRAEQGEGIRRLIAASRRPGGHVDAPALAAALALITEGEMLRQRAVSCDGESVTSPTTRRVLVANDLLGILQAHPSEDEFVRAWYLAVIAYDQGQGALAMAQTCLRIAPERIRAHPEMRLAHGALHEFGWRRQQEDHDDVSGFGADLEVAERALRAAAAADPGLEEAGLRRGRVLALRDRDQEAFATFAGVIARGDPGFSYLARLFEGELKERRQEYDAAAASYQAAVTLMPFAQSAKVALAHLAHLQGRRAEAAARTRDLTGSTSPSDSADPWFWYYKGTAWRTASYVAAFRAIVQRGDVTGR